jgi:hypothetical protein
VGVRALTLAAALLTAAVLSGCGAHPVDDAPSLDEVAAATRSDPYRFELEMRSEGFPDDPFAATANGAADPAAERTTFRFEVTGGGDRYGFESRILDGVVYVRSTLPSDGIGWLMTEPGDVSETARFGVLVEPHKAAEAVARHGRDVAAGPGEPIEGTATTHYRAEVPTIELFDAGESRLEREELEREIRESGSEWTEVDASAGADGLLRRLDVVTPVEEDGRTGRFVAKVRFFDFGDPVEIEAPPKSEMYVERTEPHAAAADACRGTAAPHSAEKIDAALREAGFEILHTTCLSEETSIEVWLDSTPEAEYFGCSVHPRPVPRDKLLPESLVAANVVCDPRTPELRTRVQAVLDGL